MKQNGKTIVLLAALATASIHIMNRMETSHATIKSNLTSTKNKYYEWRFGKIRYTKKGNGTPLLLLHDLTVGSSSYEFYKLEKTLSEKHEVYCIDLLGYGLSDKPDITLTGYLYVQILTDFIKNVIGKKTDIVATGSSFPLAVMACHNDSSLFRKLVAINPEDLSQMNQIPTKQTKLLKLLIETPVFGTFLYNRQTNKASFLKQFQEKNFYNPYKIEEKDILSYVEASHLSDYHAKYTYASLLGRYMNLNMVHSLKEINNSIYLIMGKEEENAKTTVDNYTFYNNAVETIYLPKTKHLPQLESPDQVLSCLDLFLS